MIRGIGKRVVVLKNTDSELFEEAIFIIKNEKNKSQKDILTECERIINLATPKKEHKKIISKNILFITAIISFSIFSIILLFNIL